MLKQRLAAANSVAQAFRPAEATVEIAVIETSRIVTVMMEARRDGGLGRQVGNHAIELASRASMLLVEAQRTIHDAHAALGPVLKEIGLSGREHMYGCEDPPPNGPGQSFVRVLFGESEHQEAVALNAEG